MKNHIKAASGKKQSFRHKKIAIQIAAITATIVVIILLAFRLSPAPGAFVVKTVFDNDAHKKRTALQVHTPQHPVTVLTNLPYDTKNKDTLLDVYIPEIATNTKSKLPVLIWTHGGAWLSGDKTDAEPYFKLLADTGIVVVSLNYSLAPGAQYPMQLHQINKAHAYILNQAERFSIDTSKILLAGDSAGAQLSSQIATVISNKDYAKKVSITPSLDTAQLSGIVLFCGIYKMDGLANPSEQLPKIVGWGNDVTLWSYTGSRDRSNPILKEMSAYYNVDGNFPKTFISGGNGDPLTNAQSIPFADKLRSLNVETTSLFYKEDHTPSLPHEYQFTLDGDGRKAFDDMVEFVEHSTEE